MREEELRTYQENGFTVVPERLSEDEVGELRAQLPALLSTHGPQRVMEKDGVTVRSVYGSHLTDPVFRELAHDARILGAAERILGEPVYIYQSKINLKKALSGDVWLWHQDYVFWLEEDGVREPALTTAVVFLDDVGEFNAPLLFVPGSHRLGLADTRILEQAPGEYRNHPEWIYNLTADLKYTIRPESFAALALQSGLVAAKGTRGSVLFMHANIFHASPPNLSPYDRALLLITFNSVRNAPLQTQNPRPEFLCSRDCAAARVDDRFARRAANPRAAVRERRMLES